MRCISCILRELLVERGSTRPRPNSTSLDPQSMSSSLWSIVSSFRRNKHESGHKYFPPSITFLQLALKRRTQKKWINKQTNKENKRHPISPKVWNLNLRIYESKKNAISKLLRGISQIEFVSRSRLEVTFFWSFRTLKSNEVAGWLTCLSLIRAFETFGGKKTLKKNKYVSLLVVYIVNTTDAF